MREIVIVLSDLYLGLGLGPQPQYAPAYSAGEIAAGAASLAGETQGGAPGIERVARFGDKRRLTEGWRAWVARWLGLPQCAGAAPASVAAAAAASVPAGRTVWMARPLHLLAGLATVHCDRRSLLRLAVAEAQTLAASFADAFRGSGLDLHPLESGELLLSGPGDMMPAITTEPARLLLAPFAESLPAGEGAVALRRLGAEIEMWLYAHPLREQRMRRGAPPVSTLWVWGGGPQAARGAVAQETIAQEPGAAAFGSDAYIQGLWRIAGGEALPQPLDWTAVIGAAREPRVLCVVEVAELLQAHSSWSLADAVAAIDRELLAPALAALRRRELDRLVVLANDHCLSLRAAHFWRLWRHVGTPARGAESLA